MEHVYKQGGMIVKKGENCPFPEISRARETYEIYYIFEKLSSRGQYVHPVPTWKLRNIDLHHLSYFKL